MRAADRADLLRVLTRVGRGPADHLADLGLAVAVEHGDAELLGEALRLDRRQRGGDAAHEPERREVGDRGVVEHRHRRRRQDGRPDLEPRHELGELLRLEPVHHDDRRAGPQPEQDVVDARVQRERHRDEVGRELLRRVARLGPQRTEHPVDELEVRRVRVQDRLRLAGRARGPHHERGVLGVAMPVVGHDLVDGVRLVDGEPRTRRVDRRGRPRPPGSRGLIGTKTPPASQIPNIVVISSGPSGSCTATAAPGGTP